MPFSIRLATTRDVPELEALVARSARILSQGYYAPEQSEAAITHIFGVDSELIADASYYLAEVGGEIIGCGGWSARPTLFGGDRFGGRQQGLLDPATQPAKIRAFFVDPGVPRRGIGSALLETSERAAAGAGFGAAELMATLPGEPFYTAHGYVATGRQELEFAGVSIPFIPMQKALHWSASNTVNSRKTETA